jgi:squalene-hopene/tetraprenyl-beta-curcumene cyclase
LDEAIDRSIGFLLNVQNKDLGFWVDELEADSTLTSEYLMLRFFLGNLDPLRRKRAMTYLKKTQLPEGGWSIYYGAPSNISASVKAYFALKLCGVSRHEPFMKKAREVIMEMGGVPNVNVFTKISLALFGQYDWRDIPFLPPEIILLSKRFYFNLYEVSYWSRAVIVPLLIIYAKKPLCVVSPNAHLDELFPEGHWDKKGQKKRDYGIISWKNVFLTLDSCLKVLDRFHLKFLREKAVQKAHHWLVEHMRGEGGLGAIYPAMANSIVALRAMGNPPDHTQIQKALGEIEDLEINQENSMHLQPCVSPIWDTPLTINALLEAGITRDHPSIVKGAQWLLSKQVSSVGDWKVKVPAAEPGGWYFQFENEFYPDNDDTSVVLVALCKSVLPDEEEKRKQMVRGIRWFLKMQGSDGGWGAFDKDNNKKILNNIPFADHGALLDPSTADLTGRGLEFLGLLGFDEDFPPAKKALHFLKKEQEKEGGWYGRWGVNYIYGTWSVLSGLKTIGQDLNQDFIRRAVDWLKRCQNPDGGWGESCESYSNPSLAGVGNSTASQTAWALMGLLQAGEVNSLEVLKGVLYLLKHQREQGKWDEAEFTGTGFPKVFYLRYHMYSKYFPLWALAQFRSLKLRGKLLSDDVREENKKSGIFLRLLR